MDGGSVADGAVRGPRVGRRGSGLAGGGGSGRGRLRFQVIGEGGVEIGLEGGGVGGVGGVEGVVGVEAMKHIPRGAWTEARHGVAILRELGSEVEAAAVERILEECRERGGDLAQERARMRDFRARMRARVSEVVVKCALALRGET